MAEEERVSKRGIKGEGRPLKIIDPEMVRQLAMIDCSYDEMAAVLKCDPKTLTNRFSQVIKEGREEGRSSLKRAQYKAAMNGNTTMLIWLGKQRLGQRDSQYLSSIDEDGKVVPLHVYIPEIKSET